MEDSKNTFKTHFSGNTVKFTAVFHSPLFKKEIKDLKNSFLFPYTEDLTRYKKTIDKFIHNHQKFIRMLQKSELAYQKLPFKYNESRRDLDGRNIIIQKQLDEYSLEGELENMKPFTGLSEFEKENLARGKKRALEKEQSQIQKKYETSKASIKEYNSSMKRTFIHSQWKEYNRFLVQNQAFRKVLNHVIKSHLKEEYAIEIDKTSDYSMKEDLLLIIRDQKKIDKKLQKRSVSFRKEFSERIKSWENDPFQKFFPSIFTSSNFKLRCNKSVFELTFDVKMMYEKILEQMYKFYSLENPHQEFNIAKDKSCIFNDYLFMIEFGLPEFLNSLNYTDIVSYSILNEKMVFRFNFESLLKEMCEDIIKNRKKIELVPLSAPSLKERVIDKVKVGIPVSAIVATILIISLLFISIPSVRVEKNDSVRLDYIVWVSDEDENYDALNPELDAILWINVIPVTENESTGLILGLYNNLLGKKINFDSGLLWLNKCIDQDRNGIDDSTGQVALTYGNSTDLYFNTCLMIQFRILDIQKYNPTFFWDLSDNVLLYSIGIIMLSIMSIFLLIRVIIFGSDRLQKRKLKPKRVSQKKKSRKFRLYRNFALIITIPLLLIVNLGIINIVTPIPEIILSSKYHPFVLPRLIGFLICICALYIPIFLVISNMIYDRIKIGIVDDIPHDRKISDVTNHS